ncbi:hypothetical protein ACG2LH_09590 [Zhouia sp. PK063]|uniref:hypothetical protein n=1 Tax=Zhouia sp. PK063 TaxID=3373602 RepID=UPI00379C7767
MIKKEIAIGFVVGIIANIIGILIYILAFSKMNITNTLQFAKEQGFIGSLITLGAILNLIAFFGFIKIKRYYRARGVLLATVIAALFILFFKLF